MFEMGSRLPENEEILFGSLAKVQDKFFTYPPQGVLGLTREGRLTFVTPNGLLYNWPIAAVAKVRSSWYQLGEGFRCEVDGHKYWVYFNKLASTARRGMLVRGTGAAAAAAGIAGAVPLARSIAGVMEIASARGLCSDWKAVIVSAQLPSAPDT